MATDDDDEEEDEVLRLASEIYAPFDRAETQRLRRFVSTLDELAASSFFQDAEQSVTISAERGGPLTTNLKYPGEESVRAVVGLFRQLYNHHEPTSFHQICKLLGQHAHARASPRTAEATAALKELRDWEKTALETDIALKNQKTDAAGNVVSEEDLTPRVLIDLFINGKYLHGEAEKEAKLNEWPVLPMAQMVFFTTMVAHRNVWWIGANVVREVLKVPALLDAPS